MILLNREDFKSQVFKRDQNLCVMCKKPAVDAHHLIERKLWSDGGYYIENGVSLCSNCHIEAEKTNISVKELRFNAGIKTTVLPEGYDESYEYDKWGNIVHPSGVIIKGEMFSSEQVQKIMSHKLPLVSERIKYPRTYHLPYSPGTTSDDRLLSNTDHFSAMDEIIESLKMDGENSTLARRYIHARSLDSKNHESRNWLKSLHQQIAHDIPEGWRICGENMYAKHSIFYDSLDSYFLVFSIWDENNVCLSYDDTVEYCNLLDLKMVPTIYRGKFDEKICQNAYEEKYAEKNEGYVIRNADSFPYAKFISNYAKYVRKNHVQTSEHWTREKIIPNQLKQSE